MEVREHYLLPASLARSTAWHVPRPCPHHWSRGYFRTRQLSLETPWQQYADRQNALHCRDEESALQFQCPAMTAPRVSGSSSREPADHHRTPTTAALPIPARHRCRTTSLSHRRRGLEETDELSCPHHVFPGYVATPLTTLYSHTDPKRLSETVQRRFHPILAAPHPSSMHHVQVVALSAVESHPLYPPYQTLARSPRHVLALETETVLPLHPQHLL